MGTAVRSVAGGTRESEQRLTVAYVADEHGQTAHPVPANGWHGAGAGGCRQGCHGREDEGGQETRRAREGESERGSHTKNASDRTTAFTGAERERVSSDGDKR